MAYTESRNGTKYHNHRTEWFYPDMSKDIYKADDNLLGKNIYNNVIVVDYFYTFEFKIIGLLYK